jgi:hypothetical protein
MKEPHRQLKMQKLQLISLQNQQLPLKEQQLLKMLQLNQQQRQ